MKSQRRSPKAGKSNLLLLGLSLIFLVFGMFILGYMILPTPTASVMFQIPEGSLPGAPVGRDYVSYRNYSLVVSWPARLRLGETGKIGVEIQVVETPEKLSVPDHIPQILTVEPILMDVVLDPPGSAQANIGSGQDINLSWGVTPREIGVFPGKVVVSFSFFDETLAELVAVPVVIVDVAIRSTALWGLEANLAVWFGVISLILSGTLVLLRGFAQE